jgi:hypothetical protein
MKPHFRLLLISASDSAKGYAAFVISLHAEIFSFRRFHVLIICIPKSSIISVISKIGIFILFIVILIIVVEPYYTANNLPSFTIFVCFSVVSKAVRKCGDTVFVVFL